MSLLEMLVIKAQAKLLIRGGPPELSCLCAPLISSLSPAHINYREGAFESLRKLISLSVLGLHS